MGRLREHPERLACQSSPLSPRAHARGSPRPATSAILTLGVTEELPIADSRVDLVVSTNAFGHWSDPVAGLREVRRVLQPVGSLLLAEHAPPGALLSLLLRVRGRLPNLYDASAMEELLREGALVPQRVETPPGCFVVGHAVPGDDRRRSGEPR